MKPKTEVEKFRLNLKGLIAWVILILFLYLVNLKNDLLYHTITELFSVIIAYIVFFIMWKSKSFIPNRYLIFIGTIYFFVGSNDLLHTMTFRGMGTFQVSDPNLSIQLYLIARYLESTSFLIAPLFLIQNEDNEINDTILLRNSQFARRIFLIYALITACLLISVLYLKNFPTCYVIGSGDTPFYEISEYIISFMLLGSLVLLYKNRDGFENKVFESLSMSIIFTLLGEMPYLTYSFTDQFPRFIGLFFKTVSFYYLYVAFVGAGFDLPMNMLLRKNKQEELLKQEATFLSNEQNHIYSLLGVRKNIPEKTETKNSQRNEEDYYSFMQNFNGILFQLDKDFLPILIEGPVEEITGYSKEDFLSGKVKWADIIISEYLPTVSKKVVHLDYYLKEPSEAEYRIKRKDGEIRWIRETFNQISGDKGIFQGSIHDITQRKMIEETLRKQEAARIKEIHHRIKNNLQVISSLLDLQSEKLSGYETCNTSKVIEAFKDSQNRVISMALIHEELYESKDMVTLNFAGYLQKLAIDILNSYAVRDQIDLKLNLKQIYLGMDTAIPLGIVVNELVSNSIKHAFPAGCAKCEIQINLWESKNSVGRTDNSSHDDYCMKKNDYQYILEVSDNGTGIPKDIDIENSNSLGLQLVNILVEQIDGCLEVKSDNGTKFTIWFNNLEHN
jgi:PAS domain S-box-containing protein